MWEPGQAETSAEFSVDQERPVEGVVLLAVAGEVDLHVAPTLRERLNHAVDTANRAVVLDFSDVTFVDSMALSVIVGANKRARSRESEVRLVVSRPEIRRVLEITLLDRVIPVDPSREDALAAVAA